MADVWVRPGRDGVALVSVTGELDIATTPPLRAALARFSADPRVRLLVCDLSGVSFFACSGISTLLDAHAELGCRGARLRVVAAGHAVLRPLALLELLDVFDVSPDVRSALR